jgi:hypothetical protein
MQVAETRLNFRQSDSNRCCKDRVASASGRGCLGLQGYSNSMKVCFVIFEMWMRVTVRGPGPVR